MQKHGAIYVLHFIQLFESILHFSCYFKYDWRSHETSLIPCDLPALGFKAQRSCAFTLLGLVLSSICADNSLVLAPSWSSRTKIMATEGETKAEETAPANPEKEEEKLCRCVVLTGFGGLNKVEVQLRPKPKPAEGHVLVKVHAWWVLFYSLLILTNYGKHVLIWTTYSVN